MGAPRVEIGMLGEKRRDWAEKENFAEGADIRSTNDGILGSGRRDFFS